MKGINNIKGTLIWDIIELPRKKSMKLLQINGIEYGDHRVSKVCPLSRGVATPTLLTE